MSTHRSPKPPTRPKKAEAITHLRELVWRLHVEAGLADDLQRWLEDAALFEQRPVPTGRPQFNEETVAVAGVLLIDHRIGSDPWLAQEELDLDAPIWAPGYEALPPGLAFQEPSNSLRATMLNAIGAVRVLVPVVHWPATAEPWPMRQRLTLQEILDYLEEHGF